jgi:hypothetical protein
MRAIVFFCITVLVGGLALLPAPAAQAVAGRDGFFAQPEISYTYSARKHRRTRDRERDQAPAQGPFQLIVSIAKQQIALYGRKGLIARADISTGMSAHPTPKGVFTVLSKAKWHESNIYSGAPMPYMQRITWSGIALHAGPRPGYPASHGCIRLPENFAVRLFHTTKVGTRVIVARNPVEPVAFSHPKLFVHQEAAERPEQEVTDPVKTALTFAARKMDSQVADAESQDPAATDDPFAPLAAPPALQTLKPGPISVFVSRKQQRVFVRQHFTPLFDWPVAITEPDRPIGTHVFTALAPKDDSGAFRWTVVSIPSSYRHQAVRSSRRHHRRDVANERDPHAAASSPAEALDRIVLPPEVVEQISALIVPGSSVIVSDNELSDETDEDTDFIVLTP